MDVRCVVRAGLLPVLVLVLVLFFYLLSESPLDCLPAIYKCAFYLYSIPSLMTI